MENGYYYTVTRIKESATPIDNIEKWAWDDDDYETVELWHEYTEEEIAEREAQEAEAQKREEREAFLEKAPVRVDGLEGQMAALISAFETEVN